MALLRYFDVAVLVIAAPIMLLIGVPAGGYLVGAGAWIVLRLIGVGIERAAVSVPEASQQIGLRLGYMLSRLFLLALAVVVFAFTVQLAISPFVHARTR